MSKYKDALKEFNYMDSNDMKFEHFDNMSKKVIREALTRMAEIEEGKSVVVPVEPTEEQWGGLARAIMMGRDMGCIKANQMRKHLEMGGHEIPDWLDKELQGEKHLAKGDMCVFIYKAMIAASGVRDE